MTKHILPKPLAQVLKEMTTSATRGYFYLRDIEKAIDACASMNGNMPKSLPVALELKEDICNCLYLAKEYSGDGEIVYRDIKLEFK